MKSGGSKKKGGEFERTICKTLSLWLSGGQRTDLLWRAAMSGGRATLALKEGSHAKAQAGDVSAIDSVGFQLIEMFVIECKFWKDIQITQAVATGKGKLLDFWEETKVAARLNKKYPILLVKQNNFPILIVLDKFGQKNLFKSAREPPIVVFPRIDANIRLFDEFLNLNPDTALKRCHASFDNQRLALIRSTKR